MNKKEEQTMTFEIQATPEIRKAIENLLMDAEDAPFVLYGKDKCGGMHPIANLTKHPDCPDGWFDEIIESRWTVRKELIDKAEEWLKANVETYLYLYLTWNDSLRCSGKMIEDFRKAMVE
ncbi:MAG: hypothetical protein IKI72_03900 [Bacteroidales bacterium]|nr:hypothetical protein [Bacteroidales bacterium]